MGQRKTTEDSGINRHRFVAHARGVVRGRSRTRVEWFGTQTVPNEGQLPPEIEFGWSGETDSVS